MSQANIELVQTMYAAFQRGDVGTIIGACSAQVDWCMVGSGMDYPGFAIHRGPEGVKDFFDVSAHWDFSEFSANEFFTSGDKVVVLGAYAGKLKRNGAPVRSDWVHVFEFKDGQVVYFREFTDTAQVAVAWAS